MQRLGVLWCLAVQDTHQDKGIAERLDMYTLISSTKPCVATRTIEENFTGDVVCLAILWKVRLSELCDQRSVAGRVATLDVKVKAVQYSFPERTLFRCSAQKRVVKRFGKGFAVVI